MKKPVEIIEKTLSVLFAVCCFGLYPPYVQNYAVALVERLKNDDINDVFWKQQMSAFATCTLVFILLLNLILWTKKGRELFNGFCQAVKGEFDFIIQNRKYFIFLLALYLLGYFTIIRSNFCYIAIDDLPRKLEGCREWVNWYRYLDEFGSILVHTSARLIDIAPLTQFIAIFFVTLASFIAVQAANGHMSYLSCIASLPVGLFPYFLTNMSYRFDSPYMAVSVFAGVMPFAFRKERRNFIIASVLGLLLMCVSYQASSGIYIVMTMLCVLTMRGNKESWKETVSFIITAICCYVAALLFFHFTFMEREFKPGNIDERMSIANIAGNATRFVTTVWQGLGKSAIKLCVILTFVLNILLAAFRPGRGRLEKVLLTLLFYALAVPFSYGVYLAMGSPLWDPRGMYGIGFFVAAATILLCRRCAQDKGLLNTLGCIIIIASGYSLMTFSFAYGNAQFEQDKYAEFRTELLLADLSKVLPEQGAGESERLEILVLNGIGYAPATRTLIKAYPLAAACLDTYSSGGRSSQNIMNYYGFFDFVSGKSHHLEKEDLPVLADTAYHRIQGSGSHYTVTFKTPEYRVIKTRGFIEE